MFQIICTLSFFLLLFICRVTILDNFSSSCTLIPLSFAWKKPKWTTLKIFFHKRLTLFLDEIIALHKKIWRLRKVSYYSNFVKRIWAYLHKKNGRGREETPLLKCSDLHEKVGHWCLITSMPCMRILVSTWMWFAWIWRLEFHKSDLHVLITD